MDERLSFDTNCFRDYLNEWVLILKVDKTMTVPTGDWLYFYYGLILLWCNNSIDYFHQQDFACVPANSGRE